MPPIRQQAIEKMRRDHEHMLDLIQRIQAQCDQRDQRDQQDNCGGCYSSQRVVCRGNIGQMIRAFVEMTLKHNLLESMYMDKMVPTAHRIAHNQAHMEIAEQLKEIRVVFSDDGNGIQAIEGIDRVRDSLLVHFHEHDQQLEGYLAAAASP